MSDEQLKRHFDILFLDTTSNKYYDRLTLEKSALGGSEASVVRIAEGLAGFGLRVAIVQSKDPYFEPTMGQFCFFLHTNDIDTLSCKHYVQVRRNGNPTLFSSYVDPSTGKVCKTKKYIWLHDVLTKEGEGGWEPSLIDNKVTLIGVSKWHRKNIKKVFPNYSNVEYIYNPVPDEIYVGLDAKINYKPELLVWTSSPHKGLGHALDVFAKIRAREPKMQLVIFNPGYLPLDINRLATMPGVAVYGALNCHSMWGTIQQALCVFYPTSYEETFGLVAAEANAIGVPLATHSVAALQETVSTDSQFFADDDKLIDGVLDWYTNGRPKVVGQDQFRLSTVIMEWIKLLAR